MIWYCQIICNRFLPSLFLPLNFSLSRAHWLVFSFILIQIFSIPTNILRHLICTEKGVTRELLYLLSCFFLPLLFIRYEHIRALSLSLSISLSVYPFTLVYAYIIFFIPFTLSTMNKTLNKKNRNKLVWHFYYDNSKCPYTTLFNVVFHSYTTRTHTHEYICIFHCWLQPLSLSMYSILFNSSPFNSSAQV